MSNTVTFKGKPLTLVGRTVKINSPAFDFRVQSGDLQEVSLADMRGKIKIINFFPSLDTPVCDLQVKEFNKQAKGFSDEVVVVGMSKDLPFAQKRFCHEFEITNEMILSDYRTSSFGINYGLLIKELSLLARGVLIIDKNDIVRYLQIVQEITQPVNYKEALTALEEVFKNPFIQDKAQQPVHCKPCEGGIPPLAKERVASLLAAHRGWQVVDDKKLVKELKFRDFVEAMYFVELISVIVQEQGHHPTLTIAYNKVRITLTTHAVGGLSENDFIMARIIDELGGQQ